jgi:ABC-type transporter Mla MlaB component
MGLLGPVKVAVPFRPGEHACCHFTDADDRERLSLGFLRDGLRRGDKVLYLCDSDNLAVLVSRLTRRDPAFEPAIARGQIEIRPAPDAYIAEGEFEPERMLSLLRDEYGRALAEGHSGLSLIGEIPPALCDSPSCEQLYVYEARLASDHRQQVELSASSYSILCQYDHGRCGPGILTEVVDAHQVHASPELATIGRKGVLAAARDRARDALRLAGELDFDCAQTVSDVLDAHFHGPLRLDLADLTYVDVAGMRALRGRKRQQVTITPASDVVRRLLELLAWDTDPAIELVEVA